MSWTNARQSELKRWTSRTWYPSSGGCSPRCKTLNCGSVCILPSATDENASCKWHTARVKLDAPSSRDVARLSWSRECGHHPDLGRGAVGGTIGAYWKRAGVDV